MSHFHYLILSVYFKSNHFPNHLGRIAKDFNPIHTGQASAKMINNLKSCLNSMNQWSALALGLVLRVSLLLRFFSSLKGIRFRTKTQYWVKKVASLTGACAFTVTVKNRYVRTGLNYPRIINLVINGECRLNYLFVVHFHNLKEILKEKKIPWGSVCLRTLFFFIILSLLS